jgi:nicotinamidase-related amidase
MIRRQHVIGTFTSTDSALLLIDHQIGTMKLIKNIPLDVVKRNTLALAKTATILGVPVVLTSSQEENVLGRCPARPPEYRKGGW